MSIPRLAIQRPVTMFMISGVITLLGADLADAAAGRPDAGVRAADAHRAHQLHRRRSARDGGADHAADRAGGQRGAGRDARRVHVVGRQQPGAPQLRLGHRPVGGRRRSPHPRRPRARPPAGRRRPADHLQVRLERAADHAARRRGRLRPGDAARAGAERAVAALRARGRRGGGHRQRRPAPPDSRRALEGKDHRAQPVGRPRRPDAAPGEPEHAARRDLPGRRHLPRPQPGPVPEPRRHPQPRRDDARGRAGLPARHRRGEGRHRAAPLVHAHQRQAGRPDAGAEAVGQEHRRGRPGRAGGSRARQPRGARHPA